MTFGFGYAVCAATSSSMYRVQDHLRGMGLGRKGPRGSRADTATPQKLEFGSADDGDELLEFFAQFNEQTDRAKLADFRAMVVSVNEEESSVMSRARTVRGDDEQPNTRLTIPGRPWPSRWTSRRRRSRPSRPSKPRAPAFCRSDPTRPKILFEGHAFHRLTGGRFAQQRPDLSYPKWDKTKYSGTLDGRVGSGSKRRATSTAPRRCSRRAGACFRSWASTTRYCGCPDVEAFVALQHAGADEQLECFARFVARPPYLAALQSQGLGSVRQGVQRPAAREEQLRAEDGGRLRDVRCGAAGREQAQARRQARPRTTSAAAAGPREFAPVRRDRASAPCASATCGPTPSTCATGSIGRASRSRRPTSCGRTTRGRSSSKAIRTRARASRSRRVLEYLLERRTTRSEPRTSRASCSTAWRGATTSGPRRTRPRTAARRCAAR